MNSITYCCNDCRSEGIEVVVDKKCCEIHHHHHLEHEDALGASGHTHDAICMGHQHCASDEDEDEDCCGLERIAFEWESSVIQIPVSQPVATDLLCFSKYNIPQLTEAEVQQATPLEEVRPPLLCPRVYLSLLTTLLV
ncbi:MAG: hypothetical protein LIO97_11075 [Tannerellaceae bacterium]|nr:hypothetical protein [Tannerellaceae bacterium]